MTFTISRTELLTALSITGKAVSSNPFIPIQSCYLFDVKNNECVISANNLERFISERITCKSEIKIKVAIYAKDLSFIKDLPEQPLIFDITDRFKIKITTNNGSYETSGEDGFDFPLMVNTTKQTLRVSSSILIKGIDKTLFACDNDTTLPLGGVFIELNNNEITFTATNKNVFSTVLMEIESKVVYNFILPKPSATALLSLLPDCDVNIIIGKNNVGFYFGNTTIICALMVDGYPEWRNFINKDSDKVVSIDKLELKSAIARVRSFSNKVTSKIDLSISDGLLSITGSDQDFEKSAKESIVCNYSGENFSVGCNGVLLSDCLQKFDVDAVFISFSTPMRPVIIRSSSVDVQGVDNLSLVMPILNV